MNVSVRMLCLNFVIFFSSCVNGFLIDASNSPHENTNCSFKPADVVFLLDSSGSVGSASFNQIKNLVKIFVEKSVIGPSNVQVSVVTFSSTVIDNFKLSRYQSNGALLRALNRVSFTSGGTQTSKAILHAVQHSFTQAAGDRPLVPNFLIVVTDGQSNVPSNTKEAASLAHQAGIITFAMGIGSSVSSQELQNIATDHQHVFQVQTFNALSNLENELTTTICEALSNSVHCLDKLSNCAAYSRSVCSSPYVAWAKYNCPLYCGFCIASPTTSLPSPTTQAALLSSVNCSDKLPNCAAYSPLSCVPPYTKWAKDNCSRYCGFCTDPTMYVKIPTRAPTPFMDTPKTSLTTSFPSLTSQAALSSSVHCSDKLPNCTAFSRSSCVAPYSAWAKDNCPRYCGFCTAPSLNVAIPATAPTPFMDTPKTPLITTLPPSTTQTGLTCPVCDDNLNCVWNRACFLGEVCMIRQYHNTPFTVHCSKKQDCIFMKTFVKGAEIMCCEDHQCISNIIS